MFFHKGKVNILVVNTHNKVQKLLLILEIQRLRASRTGDVFHVNKLLTMIKKLAMIPYPHDNRKSSHR